MYYCSELVDNVCQVWAEMPAPGYTIPAADLAYAFQWGFMVIASFAVIGLFGGIARRIFLNSI